MSKKMPSKAIIPTNNKTNTSHGTITHNNDSMNQSTSENNSKRRIAIIVVSIVSIVSIVVVIVMIVMGLQTSSIDPNFISTHINVNSGSDINSGNDINSNNYIDVNGRGNSRIANPVNNIDNNNAASAGITSNAIHNRINSDGTIRNIMQGSSSNNINYNNNGNKLDYDGYIELSRLNQWEHPTPTSRLSYLASMYSQSIVIDQNHCRAMFPHVNVTLSNDESKKVIDNSKELIAVLKKDLEFVASSLIATTNREIDLTQLFVETLHNTNRLVFRLMKETLASCRARTVTRMQIEQTLASELYFPSLLLLRIASSSAQMRSMLAVSQPTTKHFGCFLEFGERNNEMHAEPTLLALAVRLRHYSLLAPIAALGKNFSGAVIEAVRNDDEMAIALLLRAGLFGNKNHQQAPALADCIQGMNSLRLSRELNQSVLTQWLFDSISTNCGSEYVEDFESTDQSGQASHDKSSSIPEGFLNEIMIGGYRHLGTWERSELHLHQESPTEHESYLSRLLAFARNHFRECPVETILVNETSASKFKQNFVLNNLPARIVGGSSDIFNNVLNRNDWHRAQLLEHMQSCNVVSSEIPYGQLFGYPQENTTISKFFEDGKRAIDRCTDEVIKHLTDSASSSRLSEHNCVAMGDSSTTVPPYIFGTNWDCAPPQELFSEAGSSSLTKRSSSTGLVKYLQYATRPSRIVNSVSDNSLNFPPSESWKFQFFGGAPLSGAPFHSHGPAFNLLVFGEKLWFLLPPGRDIYASEHPLRWLTREYEAAKTSNISNGESKPVQVERKPCWIRQQAEEVLFVPRHWSHQILNTEVSVGFAVEILDYIT